MAEEEKGLVAKAMACAAGNADVTVVTDADYRSLFLPCDSMEESEGPAQVAGPVLTGTGAPSRAADR